MQGITVIRIRFESRRLDPLLVFLSAAILTAASQRWCSLHEFSKITLRLFHNSCKLSLHKFDSLPRILHHCLFDFEETLLDTRQVFHRISLSTDLRSQFIIKLHFEQA